MHRYPGLVSRLDGAAQEKKQRVGVILAKAAALAHARLGDDTPRPPSPLLAGDGSRLAQPKAPPFLSTPGAPPPAGPQTAGTPSAPAGPIGPAAKSKKDKKERKKEKKKEKKEKKKDKGKSGKKKRKRSSESDGSTSSAPPEDSPEDLEEEKAPSTTCYKGHFLHPAFGSHSINTTVQLQNAAVGSWGETTGHWVIMGEVVDSKVTVTYEGKRVIFSDGTIVLDGTVLAQGSVRGEVVMGGVRGGSFELMPSEPTAEAVDLASPSADSHDSPQFAEPVGGAASSDDSDDLVVMEDVSRPMAAPSRPSARLESEAPPEAPSAKAGAVGRPAASPPPRAGPGPTQEGEPRLRPGSGRPMCVKSGAMTRSKAKSKAVRPDGPETETKPKPAERQGEASPVPAQDGSKAKQAVRPDGPETKPKPAERQAEASSVSVQDGLKADKAAGSAPAASRKSRQEDARVPNSRQTSSSQSTASGDDVRAAAAAAAAGPRAAQSRSGRREGPKNTQEGGKPALVTRPEEVKAKRDRPKAAVPPAAAVASSGSAKAARLEGAKATLRAGPGQKKSEVDTGG